MSHIDAIENAFAHLKVVSDALPPLTERFAAANHSVPQSGAGFENEDQKAAAQKDIRNKLATLSDKRATLIFDEVDTSLDISNACFERIDFILKYGTDIYPENTVDSCIRDVMFHQSQSLHHAQRASGLLPTATSHMISDQLNRVEIVNERLAKTVADYKRTAQDIAAFTKTRETQDPLAALNHDAQSAEIYRNMTILLGDKNTDVVERASARITNALDYVELIDQALIPYDMGDEKDWSEQKILLLQESMNSFNTFLEHINGARGYLAQAQKFQTQH